MRVYSAMQRSAQHGAMDCGCGCPEHPTDASRTS